MDSVVFRLLSFINGVRLCHTAVSNWPIVSAPDANLGSKMVELQFPRRTEVILSIPNPTKTAQDARNQRLDSKSFISLK